MKKYIPILLSLTLHLALGGAWFFWRAADLPLGGGGGGTGSAGRVSVEILGAPSATSLSTPEIQASEAGDIPIAKKIPSRKPTSRPPASGGGLPGPVGPGSGEGQGIGSGTVDGRNAVLAEIRGKIERAKRYPELARTAGISGSVLVSFRIGDSGRAENVTVKQGSGSALLDDEAKATLSRAQPFPAYPEGLEVWIKFEPVSGNF